MHITSRQAAGVILAGGNSTRMGHDKALVHYGGLPLISHVAATLTSVFDDVRIVTNHPEAYRFLGLPSLPDLITDAGPMGGIHAALTTIEAPSIFVLACDTPFVPPDLVRAVLAFPRRHPVSVVQEEGRLHPLCGLYDRTLLPLIERLLATGQRSMMGLLDAAGSDRIVPDQRAPWYVPGMLRNINSPSDIGWEQ